MRGGEPRFMSTDGAGATHSIWKNNIRDQKEIENIEDAEQRRDRERENL